MIDLNIVDLCFELLATSFPLASIFWPFWKLAIINLKTTALPYIPNLLTDFSLCSHRLYPYSIPRLLKAGPVQKTIDICPFSVTKVLCIIWRCPVFRGSLSLDSRVVVPEKLRNYWRCHCIYKYIIKHFKNRLITYIVSWNDLSS